MTLNEPQHRSALVCRLANHANALSLLHSFTHPPTTTTPPHSHIHTSTKAPCVCGSTEGAHISLYQSRGISGGNSRLCLRGQTIATSDQSGGDAWHSNSSSWAVCNIMYIERQWGRGSVTEEDDRRAGGRGIKRTISTELFSGWRMKS